MSAPRRNAVTVLCAWPDRVWRRALDLPEGATVADALSASGWPDASGLDVDVDDLVVALHGQAVPPERVLQAGDRLALCRPLKVDPREARRRQAAAARRGR